jgi:DNA-binding beta-propeller fold protein YncE
LGPNAVVKNILLKQAGLVLALVALAFPASASADLFSVSGTFGSGVQSSGRFVSPAGVATDNAGRVYVADTDGGRIEVFDSGEAGNGYLRSIGQGQLNKPVGIAVDLRNRLFVVDAARDTVLQYDSYIRDSAFMREWGGSGTELGKMSGPRFVVPDRSGLVYNTERGNVRVQWFTPRESQMQPVSAFGTADPPNFDQPEGIARDDALGQLYVTNESAADGAVRVYDSRGLLLGQLAGPGPGPGKLTSPRGIMLDPLGRVIVADTGDNRLEVFGPFSGGGGFIESFAGAELSQPVALAYGPGAFLYVTDAGTGRVVRFHYDDRDRDNVLDERDNCAGLDNGDQSDIDRDGSGDACDSDDDADGIADGADACPASRKGPDTNRDGCADPRSTISFPAPGSVSRGQRLTRVIGTAKADRRRGVARVEVAIARVSGAGCRWYSGGGTFTPVTSCATPRWMNASGTAKWTRNVRVRGRGTYRVLSRAIQRGGVAETRRTARNARVIRVR